MATMVQNRNEALKPLEEEQIHDINGAVEPTNESSSRGNWVGKLDFVMSALSFAVGMGNIWRFPYLCYKNGGGAFLIPYVVTVALAGIPMMYLEFAFGQYAGEGIVSIWKVSPLFQGIGWVMFSVSFITSIYYNMLIAYSFFYMFASLQKDVPWKTCGNSWNTIACGGFFEMRNCMLHNGTWYNSTCHSSMLTLPADVQQQIYNASLSNSSITETLQPKSAADEYFHNFMLDISESLTELGPPVWKLALVLLFTWILITVCLAKGIKSLGKATYVTAMFPYIILTILLTRGLLLDGSADGILYYITPDFAKLLTARVWADAAIQVFFSMSICWGGLITLASYNSFNNNCLRDAFVVGIGDALTSIFGGFVIFAFIGFMANELQVPINEVATQGAGLAFIIYPSAVASLPISPLWSILFMLMLVNLGIGTQFTIVTTTQTTIIDMFPETLRKGRRPLILLICICSVCYLLGLFITTQGGMYVLQLMDNYVTSYALLIIGLLECVVLSWVYGYKRFFKDIEHMLGQRPSLFWFACWGVITPTLIIGILLFAFIDFSQTRYDKYIYPVWAEVIGWIIVVCELAFLPGVAIYNISKADKKLPIIERIRLLTMPTVDWGPSVNRKLPGLSTDVTTVDPLLVHGFNTEKINDERV